MLARKLGGEAARQPDSQKARKLGSEAARRQRGCAVGMLGCETARRRGRQLHKMKTK